MNNRQKLYSMILAPAAMILVLVNIAGATESLTLSGSATTNTYDAAGQTITYTYIVTNSGTVDLTATEGGGSFQIEECINGVGYCNNYNGLQIFKGTLAPGQSFSFTSKPYTITQYDLDYGYVVDNASAMIATYGYLSSNQITLTATANQNPALTIAKSAKTNNPADSTTYNAKDQYIIYNYNVTNSGNVDIFGPINVTDNRINGGIPFTETGNPNLSPGTTGTVGIGYRITQADIDTGSVTNSAYARFIRAL